MICVCVLYTSQLDGCTCMACEHHHPDFTNVGTAVALIALSIKRTEWIATLHVATASSCFHCGSTVCVFSLRSHLLATRALQLEYSQYNTQSRDLCAAGCVLMQREGAERKVSRPLQKGQGNGQKCSTKRKREDEKPKYKHVSTNSGIFLVSYAILRPTSFP